MDEDRYEPLPPLTRLPGLLWARIGPAARAATLLAALGAIGAVILLAPKIDEHKAESAARERREATALRERRIRALRELQRPRAGRAADPADPVRDLERLITADARSRPDVGRVLRTECDPILGARSRYICTAVTSDIPGSHDSKGGVIGYPFRAIARDGRLTWCRIAGRAGEGLLQTRELVAIPRACGG